MPISSHNWMRPEKLEKTFARLKKCGYDAIELSGEPDKYNTDEVKQLMEKYGIKCWGSVTIMVGGRDLVAPDEKVRKDSLKYVLDCITMVNKLGGEILTLVPAEVGRITSKVEPEEEWGWAVDAMKQVAAHAKKMNVRVGIEPLNRFETNFINTHQQALCLAKAGGDNLGVVLDAFHINIEEADPVAAIRNVGSKLVNFHIADSNRRVPGDGHNDWKGMFDELRSIGYKGCLSHETVIPFDRTPVTRTKRDKAAADGASAEDLKFIADHGTDVLTDEEFEKALQDTANFLRKHGW